MVKHLPGFHNAFFVWLKLIQGTCVDTHKVEPVCWKQEVFHESAVSPAVWSLLWCSYSGLLQKQPNVIIPFIWHVCWGGQSLLLGCRGHLRFYVLYKVIFKEPFLRKFSIMWTWWQKKEKASFINCFTKYSMSVVVFQKSDQLEWPFLRNILLLYWFKQWLNISQGWLENPRSVWSPVWSDNAVPSD